MTNFDEMVTILPLSYPNGQQQQSNVVTLIHDAFQPLSYWTNFMPRGEFVGVAIDTHIYQMFMDEVGLWSTSLDMLRQQGSRGHLTTSDRVARRSRAYPICMRKCRTAV
jgi:hypothetical protein